MEAYGVLDVVDGIRHLRVHVAGVHLALRLGIFGALGSNLLALMQISKLKIIANFGEKSGASARPAPAAAAASSAAARASIGLP